MAVEVLRDHKLKQEQAGYTAPWVFPDSESGPRRKSNFIRRSFKPLLRSAGLPEVTCHSLRHVANSMLLAQGESVKVAAERLGHSTTRMTLDIYTHVLPTTQRSVRRSALDKIFRIGGHAGGQRDSDSSDDGPDGKEKSPMKSGF